MKDTIIAKILVLSKSSTRFEIKKQEKQLSKKDTKPYFEQIYMDVRKYLDLKDVKTDSEAYIPGSENVDPTFVYSFYLNICKERFKIFDKGERKLAFRESKDPLIKKQGCQIQKKFSSSKKFSTIVVVFEVYTSRLGLRDVNLPIIVLNILKIIKIM